MGNLIDCKTEETFNIEKHYEIIRQNDYNMRKSTLLYRDIKLNNGFYNTKDILEDNDHSDIMTFCMKVNNNGNSANFKGYVNSLINTIFCSSGSFLSNYNFAITSKVLDDINPTINKIILNKGRIISFVNDIINSNSSQEVLCCLPLVKLNNYELYEGTWNVITKKRHGYGIKIDLRTNYVYKGMWNNDKYGDYGAFLMPNGSFYVGEIKDGIPFGKGEFYIMNEILYSGDIVNGIPDGNAEFIDFKTRSFYKGTVKKGKKEGEGKVKFDDGSEYKGDFDGDKINGRGIFKKMNVGVEKGNFVNAKLNGEGYLYSSKADCIFIGNFINGKKQGKGKFIFDKNQNQILEGNWFNDYLSGTTKLKNFDDDFQIKYVNGHIIWNNITKIGDNKSECSSY